MKNINKLILKNFQQWKEGCVEFKNGLNILVGNTEAGKSTLFRAINSILTGKMPEDYIRKGTKECEVKIEFSDGTTFRRLRNKKDNIADANGLVFERVGKDIPFEYFKQLGKTSIQFGNKELSLCNYSQFEPHFFITLSDYDKSKLIGTICGIDIVDKLVDNINKDIRSNNANIKFLESQIFNNTQDKESKQKQYDLLINKAKNLEIYLKTAQDKFKTLENLSNLSDKLHLLNSDISTYKTNLNVLKAKISDFSNENIKLLERLFELKMALHIYKATIDHETNIKNACITNSGIDKNKVNLLDDLVFLKQKLEDFNKEIKIEEHYKKQVDENLFTLANQKKELLKGYDKCPLCGGIL